MVGEGPWDRVYIPDDAPEDRCGLTFEYEDDSWLPGAVTCWRETWDDHDRCVWHADIKGKPSDDLSQEQIDEPERLDGAVIRNAELGDVVTFTDSTLSGADLTDLTLWSADLTEADLRGADLTNAYVRSVDFIDADLRSADLTNAYIRSIDFIDADLRSAALTEADLRKADLTEADLRKADLTDANLRWAGLTDASLFEATLTDADLRSADLTDADLRSADLTDADLLGADLRSADLTDVDLTEADLRFVDLTDADLRSADLTDVDLLEVDLTDTDLRWANLTEADFHKANLTGAGVDYTQLDNIKIDEGTTFGGRSRWEAQADENAEAAIPYLPWQLPPLRALGRPFTDTGSLEHAELQYRATQRILRENDLRQLPELAVREKHARRKRALAERDYWTWFKLAFYRWPLGYGERVRNVLGTSAVVILGFALLYPFFGGMEATEEETTPYVFTDLLSLPFEVPEAVEILWANLYFSAVTFSTLGYGDIQPASGAAQGLASVQSLLGALLMAYLVFVLGRRTTW